jgi:hypothetical protein
MYNFTREDIDLEAMRARIARMSDAELVNTACAYRKSHLGQEAQ